MMLKGRFMIIMNSIVKLVSIIVFYVVCIKLVYRFLLYLLVFNRL